MKISIIIAIVLMSQSLWGQQTLDANYHPGCYQVNVEIDGKSYLDYIQIIGQDNLGLFDMRGELSAIYSVPSSGATATSQGSFSHSLWGGRTTYNFSFEIKENDRKIKFDFTGVQHIRSHPHEVTSKNQIYPLIGSLTFYEPKEGEEEEVSTRSRFMATFVHNDPKKSCPIAEY